MKKLLSIIVLGLMLSGNANAARLGPKQDIYTTDEYRSNLCTAYYYASKKSKRKKMFPGIVHKFIVSSIEECYETKAKASKECNDFIKRSSAKLYCHQGHFKNNGLIINEEVRELLKKNALNERKQKNSASFKEICKQDQLNKEGTKRLTDCVKKLQVKREALQNKTYSKPKNSITTSKTKRKIDPSVWDDIISLSTGVMNGSSKSKTPRKVCFKNGEEKIGFGKSCRYSCTGSLYTMMVGSMEMCPLTVER